MPSTSGQFKMQVERALLRAGMRGRKRLREWSLQPGEKGWGLPPHLPPHVDGVGRDRKRSVAIIGLGLQGVAQGRGCGLLAGVAVGGVAEVDADRRAQAQQHLRIDESRCFSDAGALLASQSFDLVSIATTAAHHVDLAKAALDAGAKRILIEKPLDVSLAKAREFVARCEQSDAAVAVNYSRRWLPGFMGVKRAIDQHLIGTVRSAHFAVGRGELAMIASHYFDLANYLLSDVPVGVQATLESVTEPNRRGSGYVDPYGYCSFVFGRGQRATFDFSSDLPPGGAHIVLAGDRGRAVIDTENLVWSIHQRGQLRWEMPLGDRVRADAAFACVASTLLNRGQAGCHCGPRDALWALEMILGAHVSSDGGGRRVALPLDGSEVPTVMFP